MNDRNQATKPNAIQKLISRLKGQPPLAPEVDYSFELDCLKMRKDASTGKYFLMCIYSNRFRDIDKGSAPLHGGEILADAAHQEFMEFLDANPSEAPELWSLHVPGTQRKNRAHWWAYDGAFAYAEFVLEEDEARGIAQFAKQVTPGLSHGFHILKYDFENAVIEKYRTNEISILPLDWAANPWTSVEMIRKELEMGKFPKEKRELLVTLHGEDFAVELEEKSMTTDAVLTAAGVDTKALAAINAKQNEEVEVEIELDETGIVEALQALEQTLGGDIKALATAFKAMAVKIEEHDALLAEVIEEVEDEEEAVQAAAPLGLLASFRPKSVIGNLSAEIPATDPLKKKQPKQAAAASKHMLAGLVDGLYVNGEGSNVH
jgi:hypothetical protein